MWQWLFVFFVPFCLIRSLSLALCYVLFCVLVVVRLLFVVCGPMIVRAVFCLLSVVCCLWFDVCCVSLFVVCCLLFVVRCSWFVVCYMLFV